MADMKESALTQQSDCKWVRALDSNGNSILISKEDLAAVVGGLLPQGTSTKRGLSYSVLPKVREGIMDVNLIYKESIEDSFSIFKTVNGSTNVPYSTGMVCNLTRRGGSKYSVLQFFFSEQGGVYIRTGNWDLESEEKYNTWEKFYPKE